MAVVSTRPITISTRTSLGSKTGQFDGGAHGNGLPLITVPAGPGPASTNRTRSHTSRTRAFQLAFSRLSA